MIAGHIEDLIHAAKSMPNSLHRNKIISHLEDARAHAMALGYTIPKTKLEGQEDASTQSTDASNGRVANVCTCPMYPAARSLTCPVHSV